MKIFPKLVMIMAFASAFTFNPAMAQQDPRDKTTEWVEADGSKSKIEWFILTASCGAGLFSVGNFMKEKNITIDNGKITSADLLEDSKLFMGLTVLRLKADRNMTEENATDFASNLIFKIASEQDKDNENSFKSGTFNSDASELNNDCNTKLEDYKKVLGAGN